MNSKLKEFISKYYRNWGAETISNSGSNREYYRISYSKDKTLIAVYSPNSNETKAFLHFTKVLENAEVNVPQIIYANKNDNIYLLKDLGEISLFDIISTKTTKYLTKHMLDLCKKALSQLVYIQFEAANKIDYDKAYPTSRMDMQSIMWDLNYFKYNFLKLTGIDFDERALENDFLNFTGIIMQIKPQTFVYRDFQSRNIIVNNDELGFIDYQGGRKGPNVYDLASFIYQAKAKFSDQDRANLISHYFNEVKKYISNYNRKTFKRDLKFVRLLRAMQTLGAYGYRGIVENKPHFVQSLDLGIENFIQALDDCRNELLIFPEMNKIVDEIKNKYRTKNTETDTDNVNVVRETPLLLEIYSFSYLKDDIPTHEKHGGGFVFDCRCLPNPFWKEDLKHLSGLDKNVKYYLNSKQEVNEFVNNVKNIINQAVSDYYDRGHESLMISFGCTGGKHRSVYCAERIAEIYKKSDKVKVVVKHLQRKRW
ncbi:MAG: phosphotransferase [Bacteroidales bacterium]|jgi:aminoglycoside/choline kinase family phosphotransferase|nr:phosphotransferase [Bacteroidales bacterium]